MLLARGDDPPEPPALPPRGVDPPEPPALRAHWPRRVPQRSAFTATLNPQLAYQHAVPEEPGVGRDDGPDHGSGIRRGRARRRGGAALWPPCPASPLPPPRRPAA